MKRKTIDVEVIKNKVNNILANYDSTFVSSEYLLGQRLLLEYILNETNNYKGFDFLKADEVPADEKPGIIWENGTTYTDDRTDGNRVRYL